MEIPKFKQYQFERSPQNNKFGFQKGDTVIFRTGIHYNYGYVVDIVTETEYPIVCLFRHGKEEIAIRFSKKGECNNKTGVQLMRLFRVGDKVSYFKGRTQLFGEVIRVSTETKQLSIYQHETGAVDRTFFEDGIQMWTPDDILSSLHLISPAITR
jgi:hypothetical protein